MAIYHLNMRSIGRSSHAAGTAGAHVRYITRPEAEPVVLAQHMPSDRWQARAWLDAQENADRKNARVADKLNIALPREMTPAQRQEVVEAFCRKLTQDRVPFYAVLHQEEGNDRENPHAHIVVRDRDFETGKRVLCLSDSPRDRTKKGFEHPKAMDQVRELWTEVCNDHLQRGGIDQRIDHRTLKAQGIDREPQIHVGAWSNRQAANDEIERPQSQERLAEAWGKAREISYPEIDEGKTRAEHNAEIIQLEEFRQERAAEEAAREQAERMDRQAAQRAAADERREARRREKLAEAQALARKLRQENERARQEQAAEDEALRQEALLDRQAQERADAADRRAERRREREEAKAAQRTATQQRQPDPPSLESAFVEEADREIQARREQEKQRTASREKARREREAEAEKQAAAQRRRVAKFKEEAKREHAERMQRAVENAATIRREMAKGDTVEERSSARAKPKVQRARSEFETGARPTKRTPAKPEKRREEPVSRRETPKREETEAERRARADQVRAEKMRARRDFNERGRGRGDTGRERSRGDPKK